MTTPRSIAARRSPEIASSRATIAATIQAGCDTLADEHHQRDHHQHLVRDRVEESAERRGLVSPPGEPAVDLVGRHRDDEDAGRPVRVTLEVPREQDDDHRDRKRPRESQLVGQGHVAREYAAHASSSARSSSRIAVRSRSGSSGRSGSSASAVSPSTRRPIEGACTRASPTRRISSVPGRQRRATCAREIVIAAALKAGAEAIHPGYGFLSENAAFAQAVEDAGLVWIGPPPAAIALMGSKTEARAAMKAAGVPIIPGTTEPVSSAEAVIAIGEEIGYPLIIKAKAGGGGKGMELVTRPEEAADAFESATRQGTEVLRRRRGLRRAVHREPAARRGAGPRRRSRQRRPSRRARLHHSAPSPEARRGDAVAGRRRRAAGADRRGSQSMPPERPATARRGRSRGSSPPTAPTTSWR